jgi:hypothetical protein
MICVYILNNKYMVRTVTSTSNLALLFHSILGGIQEKHCASISVITDSFFGESLSVFVFAFAFVSNRCVLGTFQSCRNAD